LVSERIESRCEQASDAGQERAAKENSFLQEHLSSVIPSQLLHQEKEPDGASWSEQRTHESVESPRTGEVC